MSKSSTCLTERQLLRMLRLALKRPGAPKAQLKLVDGRKLIRFGSACPLTLAAAKIGERPLPAKKVSALEVSGIVSYPTMVRWIDASDDSSYAEDLRVKLLKIAGLSE